MSSKHTKRETIESQAQDAKPIPSPSSTRATVASATDATHEHSSPTGTSAASHAHHRDHHRDPASADGRRRNSTDSAESNLTTWEHLSVDRSGAKIRTVCTHDHEDGETCAHVAGGRERRYGNIPRVDEPFERITVAGVKAMMESDGVVEREGDVNGDEDWVIIDRD